MLIKTSFQKEVTIQHLKVNIKEKAEEEFEKWNYINSKRIEIIKGDSDKIELKLNEFNLEGVNGKVNFNYESKIDNIDIENYALSYFIRNDR